MTREQQFEDRLAEWLEEGPFMAPDRALEATFAHAQAHPRRRFRLSGALAGAGGRLRRTDVLPGEPLRPGISAFAAVGAATVLLVAILGGTAILLSGDRGGLPPSGPAGTVSPSPSPAPTASPTPTPAPVAGPPGSATIDGQCAVDDPGTKTPWGDVTQYRGIVQTCRVTSSDPRLDGSATIYVSVDERADGSADTWGHATIASDGGIWSGPWRGSVQPGGIVRTTEGFYEGHGANAGLRYRYSQTSEDGVGLRGTGTIEAVDALPAAATLVRSETCMTLVFGTQEVVDGVTQYRDMVLSCGSIRSSDPRLATATAERVVINIDKLADGSATMWGTATIENDGGTWSGSWTGTVDVGYTTHRMEGRYAGAGGYAGLEFTYAQIGEQWSPFVLIGTVGPAE